MTSGWGRRPTYPHPQQSLSMFYGRSAYTNSVYEQGKLPVVRQAHHERGKGLPFAVRPELGEGP